MREEGGYDGALPFATHIVFGRCCHFMRSGLGFATCFLGTTNEWICLDFSDGKLGAFQDPSLLFFAMELLENGEVLLTWLKMNYEVLHHVRCRW